MVLNTIEIIYQHHGGDIILLTITFKNPLLNLCRCHFFISYVAHL